MSNQYNDASGRRHAPCDEQRNLDAAKNAGPVRARSGRGCGGPRGNDRWQHAAGRRQGRELRSFFPEVAHLRDDLTSAAFTGLVKAVNQMAKAAGIKRPEELDIRPIASACWIDRELGTSGRQSPLIHPPHAVPVSGRARGEEMRPPDVQPRVPDDLGTPPYEGAMEARDSLVARCTGEEERAFVAMRVAGADAARRSRRSWARRYWRAPPGKRA